jgi:hypothetical protein
MKPMAEHEVLHLGLTIAEWRVVVQALLDTEREQLDDIAYRLKSHLPRPPSADQGAKP